MIEAEAHVDEIDALQRAILTWYDAHARDLPWRVGPRDGAAGRRPDPYRVWISEVMLQQTTAAAASPRFERFVRRFPDVHALAAASEAEVLQEWAGLGYYARARNLHAAARAMAQAGMPRDEAGWRGLPGVGAYTAAAVAAIAFAQPSAPVDANIERVLIRMLALPGERAQQKAAVRRWAPRLASADRPGDWAQALMDLGAMVCTPTAPRCEICPAHAFCKARDGDLQAFPAAVKKAPKPQRIGAAFWLSRGETVWLVRRPRQGLLAGMAALPSSPWQPALDSPMAHAPAAANWSACGQIEHVFTHFALRLTVYSAEAAEQPVGSGWWHPTAELGAAGLPTVFRKAASAASGVQF